LKPEPDVRHHRKNEKEPVRSTGCRKKNETATDWDWDWSEGTGANSTGARAAGVKNH
jgi:hypothetical protein